MLENVPLSPNCASLWLPIVTTRWWLYISTSKEWVFCLTKVLKNKLMCQRHTQIVRAFKILLVEKTKRERNWKGIRSCGLLFVQLHFSLGRFLASLRTVLRHGILICVRQEGHRSSLHTGTDSSFSSSPLPLTWGSLECFLLALLKYDFISPLWLQLWSVYANTVPVNILTKWSLDLQTYASNRF